MTNRMAIALLALIGVLVSAYMAAYKFGWLGAIACGTGACETVQLSPWSVLFGVPVPVYGLVGYGALLVVALLGLQPAFADNRWIPLLLFAGAALGFLFSAYLSYLELYEIHAWCRWCIGSAVIATLIFGFSLPEARRLRAEATTETE